MKTNQVNTQNALLLASAHALRTNDMESLETLVRVVDNWTMLQEERDALMTMLEAMMEAVTSEIKSNYLQSLMDDDPV